VCECLKNKETRATVFRLTPEAEKLLYEAERTTFLTKNDIVNLAIIYFCRNTALLEMVPLLYYATRRRRT